MSVSSTTWSHLTLVFTLILFWCSPTNALPITLSSDPSYIVDYTFRDSEFSFYYITDIYLYQNTTGNYDIIIDIPFVITARAYYNPSTFSLTTHIPDAIIDGIAYPFTYSPTTPFGPFILFYNGNSSPPTPSPPPPAQTSNPPPDATSNPPPDATSAASTPTPTYDCGGGSYFDTAGAKAYADFFGAAESYYTNPCPLLTVPDILSSNIDAFYDDTAVSSRIDLYYDNITSIPSNTGVTASPSNFSPGQIASLLALSGVSSDAVSIITARDSSVHHIEVVARSQTLYFGGVARTDAFEKGHLQLRVTLDYQNGKILVSPNPKYPTPGIELLPVVNSPYDRAGFYWVFDKSNSGVDGVTVNCEKSCTEYRITYQGRLAQKFTGDINIAVGFEAGGKIIVDSPGTLARVTIVIRITDGATFCAPIQNNIVGPDSLSTCSSLSGD